MDTAPNVSPDITPASPSIPAQPMQTTPHSCSKHMFGWQKMLSITGVVVLLMLFWQWLSSPMIITVTGKGEVNVPATNATVAFAVISSDLTPQGAIASANAKAAALKTFLQSIKISESDIATSQVNAVPASLTTTGGIGYDASISISVKTTNVLNVSDLVSSLYLNGVAAVSQPILSVENENALDAQAYTSAMQDAEKKVASIASGNMKFIKKIIAVSSQSSGTTSTTTSTSDTTQNGVFKIVELVSVSYKMW